MTTIADLAQIISTRYGITDGPGFCGIQEIIGSGANGDTVLSAEQITAVEEFFAEAYRDLARDESLR